MHAAGQRHRHQTQGESHGHAEQGVDTQVAVETQGQLAEHHADIDRDHVDAQHLAALLAPGAVVEPALQHHQLAHHGQADQRPQQ
ncbi:hypothetical protein D3C71_1826030 [compost metagenome]